MNSNSPLISVIIPSKNRSDFVLKAISSVAGQTYQNLEIIVVDDGSDVPLASKLIEKYGNKVCCLRHEYSQGAPAARNTGMVHAKGEFIAFLDDDDIWLPGKLEKQLTVFKKSNSSTGLVYCGFSYVCEGVTVDTYSCTFKGNIFKDLLKMNFIGSSSLPLIKRECLSMVGFFDTNFKSFQDWDMWLRIAEKYCVNFIDEILVQREVHGDQITSNLKAKIQGREYFISKYIKYLTNNRDYLSHQYKKLSDNYFLSNNYSMGSLYSIKAFITSPFYCFNYINIFICIIPDPLRSFLIYKKRVKKYLNTFFYS